MDRGVFNKLEHMETHPEVLSYSFFTNFTIPKREDVKALFDLPKLSAPRHQHLRLRRRDLRRHHASRPRRSIHRLVDNLETFLGTVRRGANSSLAHLASASGVASLRGRTSEITRLLDRFRKAGVEVKSPRASTTTGAASSPMTTCATCRSTSSAPDSTYKNGACVRLFTTVQIMATGIVNGCACRDADATLRLGDLKEAPLHDIISSRNPVYMALIEEQQQGNFRPVCQSCDMYASIYHKSSAYRKEGATFQSIDDFKRRLRDAGRRALGAPLQPEEAAPAKSKSAAAAL